MGEKKEVTAETGKKTKGEEQENVKMRRKVAA